MAGKILIEIFEPIVNCYRLSIEQMVILEPVASEIVVGAAAYLIKEAFNEAVKNGVPENAARSFILGHVQILLATLFGATSHRISKAAENAIEYGCSWILKPGWKKLFENKMVREAIHKMLHSEYGDFSSRSN